MACRVVFVVRLLRIFGDRLAGLRSAGAPTLQHRPLNIKNFTRWTSCRAVRGWCIPEPFEVFEGFAHPPQFA